jgi:hypothetical protein
MTDMTTTVPAKSSEPSKTEAPKVIVITLEELAREMKVSPRDARMLLRLAAKQTKLYPTLGKDHVARQPWSWTAGSKALDEARKALASATA